MTPMMQENQKIKKITTNIFSKKYDEYNPNNIKIY